jgi:16S rRNA A1518/A1519 N6-dimethyltransferase RsmA/KsgA/DIM1 with predicted DNA glycosylase/AP lyase activity
VINLPNKNAKGRIVMILMNIANNIFTISKKVKYSNISIAIAIIAEINTITIIPINIFNIYTPIKK